MTFLMTGCENFLNGENIKDDIVREIYISNHECPEAKVEEPVFSDAGVARNKAIIISFSMSMDPKSFTNNYQIEDSSGNNLLANFLEPKWSNENKLVSIVPNEKNLIDLHGKKSMDVFFKLSTGCQTTDGLPLQTAINHKYRINDTTDNTPPVISAASYIERPAIYFREYLISNKAKLLEGNINPENENQILVANHINSELTIYIEGSDYGGGDVKGHVLCRRINDVTGQACNTASRDFIFNLKKLNDSENSGGSIALNLSSSLDYQDGLYEIKLFVQDDSGTDSENFQVYYVIRDTTLAYCITSRLVNDTPYFRDYIPGPFPDAEDGTWAPGEYEWKIRYQAFNTQKATLNKIQDFRKRILFDQINDDVYYTSELTQNCYSENDLTYYVSWGTDLSALTAPVKIEGQFYSDSNIVQRDDLKYYSLPDTFTSFLHQYENKDIILKAIVLDCVGNQNVIYSLWPKEINFYNYKVSDDQNGKKKVELNFADLDNKKVFEDKIIRGKYRIFYAELDNYDEDADYSDIELTRNCGDYIQNKDEKDKTEITGINADTNYLIVYIQTAYDADSIYNGQYSSTTFGPLKKIVVDMSQSGVVPLEKPEFRFDDKISCGQNSGTYIIPITITNYDSNLTYIPYYQVLIPRHYAEEPEGSGNWVWHPDEFEWTKLEAHREKTFSISVKNNLIAPLCKNQSWDCVEWDYTDYGNGNLPDNNYFQAVKNCNNEDIPYTPVSAQLKIVAANESDFSESDTVNIVFYENDDNIPPTISSEITRHDSHLSFDGHSFEFTDLIREDEGNLTEYFTYFYTPYNYAWGDNLNVLSESQIQMLPSGRAKYTGSCWLDQTIGADYRLDTSIPVNGLADGDYMYFAKLEDKYGNYIYATLGKAHIGTFKNKLKVELDKDKKYFISHLELEPDESNFDRNMINVQICYEKNWDNYYEWLNELQNCSVKQNPENGKTMLYSHIGEQGDSNKFIYQKRSGDSDSYINYDLPQRDFDKNNQTEKNLDETQWYRITMQSFNYCNDVNFKYGRPYTSLDEVTSNGDNLWNRRLGWVNGEQKYDVCTDETVSNTVYYYVPGDGEDFSDYYASFFAGSAVPHSNHSILVNVFASSCDLGSDPDEWERRGKLVATHRYNPQRGETCDFDQNVAAEDVSKAREKGLVYYAAVVHFAKGESAVSEVYTMLGF